MTLTNLTNAFPSRTESHRGSFTIGLIVTIVFVLVVWLAFWLGFQRIKADHPLEQRLELVSAPRIEFDPEPGDWQYVGDPDPAVGQGPQYANLAADGENACALSWQVGSVQSGTVELDRFATDAEATIAVMEEGGLSATPDGSAKVAIDRRGTAVELQYFPQAENDGVYSATAARVFAGSGDYVLITLMCGEAAALEKSEFDQVLTDFRVTVRLVL